MRLRSTRSIPLAAPPEPAGVYPVGLLAGFSALMLVAALVANLLGWELSPLTWYIARASGISLYLLLWASTMLGLGLSTHFLDGILERSAVFSLHAYLTALALAFLGLHMLALGADQYTAFTLADLLIPFHAGVREPWTGFGIVAGLLLAGISLSFPMRKLTGYRFWRKAHWLTLPLMLIGFMHGIGAGSDSGTLAMALLYGITGALFCFLVLYRALRGRRHRALLVTNAPPPLDRMTARMGSQ
jgi:sulfoxide reductase heme-binding subunit YedZ